MKKIGMRSVVLAATMGMAAQSQAAWYDINYSGLNDGRNADYSSVTATGMIEVSGNSVINGTLDVTFESVTTDYVLAPGTGNDGYFSWDSQINPVADPYFDSSGLLFIISGNTPGNGQPEINLYANGADNYGLWGYPGHWDYAPQSDGGLVTLTVVPEPSTTGKMAGVAALGVVLVTLRKKLSMAA